MSEGNTRRLNISSSTMVSSATDDPLVHEQPFFIRSGSSKIADSTYYERYKNYQKSRGVQIEEKKKSKFPLRPLFLYLIFISLFAFIFGFIYIGGLWNPGKKLLGMNYVIVNNDKGCYTSACDRLGLDKSTNLGNYYKKLDGTGGRFTVIVITFFFNII